MSDREFSVFMRLAGIDLVLTVVTPIIWTIVFWDSPLLVFNIVLPIFIAAIFMLPALIFIMWKVIKL